MRSVSFLLLLAWLWEGAVGESCPSLCTCAPISNRSVIAATRPGWFVECAHREIRGLGGEGDGKRLDLASLPRPTLRLVLRGNRLSVIRKATFKALPELTHLDLRECGISVLGKEAFQGLHKLRYLNLAGNGLETLNSSQLLDLNSLEEFNLSSNPLPSLPAGSLRHLHSLHSLHLDSTGLVCDCELRWLIRWLRKKKVDVSTEARCLFPHSLKGRKLPSLRRKELKCRGHFQPRLFEIRPADATRLVFPGDRLKLECRVVTGASEVVRLEWSHGGRDLATQPNLSLARWNRGARAGAKEIGVRVELAAIRPADEGLWQCRAETAQGAARSLRVHLQVMQPLSLGAPSMVKDEPQTPPPVWSPSKLGCPGQVEESRWGRLLWPPKPQGSKAQIACPFSAAGEKGSARRRCQRNGVWSSSEADPACLPGSATGRALATRFFADNSSRDWTELIAATSDLGSGTQAESIFELHLATEAAERLAEDKPDLPGHLGLIHRLLRQPSSLLRRSQAEFNVTDRLADQLRNLRPRSLSGEAKAASPFCESSFKPGPETPLALGARVIESSDPPNLACSAKLDPSASIQIGGGLAEALLNATGGGAIAAGVSFLRLPNGALFETGSEEWLARAPVFGLRVEDVMAAFALEFAPRSRVTRSAESLANSTLEAENTTGTTGLIENTTTTITTTPKPQPGIWLRLRVSIPLLTKSLRLGMRRGDSDWVFPESCRLSIPRGDGEGEASFVSAVCEEHSGLAELAAKLSGRRGDWLWLGVLQSRSELAEWERPAEALTLAPWALAAGGFLCLCLLTAAAAHCVCLAATPVSLKLRHALVNGWLCTSGLCLLFSLGAGQTDTGQHCLRISAALHYLLTATALWHSVTARTIQRKLAGRLWPKPREDEPVPPSRHGPILGLYFLAYGLPAMFLAFALALNPKDLARTRSSCLPAPIGIVAGSLYGPLGLIVLISVGLLLTAHWLARRLEQRLGRRPLTPAMDGASECLMSPARGGLGSIGSSAASSQLDRGLPEIGQLRLASFSFAFFALSVGAAAALAVGVVIPGLGPESSPLLYSVLYSLCLILLGLGVFYGHVVRRPGLSSLCGLRRRKPNSPTPTANGHLTHAHRPSSNGTSRSGGQSSQPRSVEARNGTSHLHPPSEVSNRRSIGVASSSANLPRTPRNTSIHSDLSTDSERRARYMRSMAKAYHRRRAEEESLREQTITEEPTMDVPLEPNFAMFQAAAAKASHDYVNLSGSSGLRSPMPGSGKVSPASHKPASSLGMERSEETIL